MIENKKEFKLISKKNPKSLLPNALTIFGVCLGLSSIKFALDARYEIAIIAVVFAAVIDGLDGRIARLIKGTSKFSDIGELRNKESDRIKSMELGLNKIGIKTKSKSDSIKIFGNPKIKIEKKLIISPKHDHRVAMSFFCLGQILGGKVNIHNFEVVNTSFPNFLTLMKKKKYGLLIIIIEW